MSSECPRNLLYLTLTRTCPSPRLAPSPSTLRLPLHNRLLSPNRTRLASRFTPILTAEDSHIAHTCRPTSNRERPLLHVAHVARNLLSAPRSRPFHYKERAFLCIDSFRQPFTRFSISFALDFCSSFYTFQFYFSLTYVAASAAPSSPLSRT